MKLGRSILMLCLILVFASNAGAGEGVTSADVQDAIKRGAEAAKRNLKAYRRSSNVGYSIVCVMSLLNAGVPANDPDVSDAIAQILRTSVRGMGQYEGSYQAGLINMLLAMLKVDDPGYKRLAEQVTSELLRFQAVDGGWGDYSRTQFGLLGLKAAVDLGVKVPPENFKRARRYIENGQAKDGGWGYTPGFGGSYGSMTAAGITGMFIVNEQAYRESPVCGAGINDDALKRGLDWLGDHFTVRTNPGSGNNHFYYLYALERIGVLTGQKFIGGHDWYREGAEHLVLTQNQDGSWNGGVLATEFALLYLGKGGEPIVIQKLFYGPEWNTDPYDVKDLAEQASRDLKLAMKTQVVDTKASAGALAAAPILYLQGRRDFKFTPEFRNAVKLFVEQGGFVFASNCCGSAEFDKSFRSEMSTMFPDGSFERILPSHDIFKQPHAITLPQAFMIEGLNIGCRTCVLYAPHDVCCAWSGCKGCRDPRCLAGAEAKNLGVNMIAYALNFNKLRPPLDEPDIVIAGTPFTAQRNALVIGQLFHNGDWNPDPNSIGNLTQTLKKEFGIKGEVAKRRVQAGVDELGEYPVLYLTGHRGFQLLPTQIDALRTYLDRGGFLFADACCGKQEFDTSFRKLCEQLYPDRPLNQIAVTHSVMQQPYKIEKVEYKASVKKLFAALGDAPQLEGITAPDGKLQVFYSRFNLGCELQGHGCAGCLGIAKDDAFKISVNAINYALSH